MTRIQYEEAKWVQAEIHAELARDDLTDARATDPGGFKMDKCLDIGTALFALAASGFWFASAYGRLPSMLDYWDAVPETDPFYRAIRFSVRMNKIAAALSGASALCAGVKLFV